MRSGTSPFPTGDPLGRDEWSRTGATVALARGRGQRHHVQPRRALAGHGGAGRPGGAPGRRRRRGTPRAHRRPGRGQRGRVQPRWPHAGHSQPRRLGSSLVGRPRRAARWTPNQSGLGMDFRQIRASLPWCSPQGVHRWSWRPQPDLTKVGSGSPTTWCHCVEISGAIVVDRPRHDINPRCRNSIPGQGRSGGASRPSRIGKGKRDDGVLASNIKRSIRETSSGCSAERSCSSPGSDAR